jgi:hypothetical protein
MRMLASNNSECFFNPVVVNIEHLTDVSRNGTTHILFEGNHRSCAYGLFQEVAPFTLLDNEADHDEILRLSRRGEASPFHRPDLSYQDRLDKIREAALWNCHDYTGEENGFISIEEYLRLALEIGDLNCSRLPTHIRKMIRSQFLELIPPRP